MQTLNFLSSRIRRPTWLDGELGSPGSYKPGCTASKAVFKKCIEGDNPLFCEGWDGWPEDVNQDDVLSWIAKLGKQLAISQRTTSRRRHADEAPLTQSNKLIHGSTAERKLDIGFVNDPKAGKDSRYHWSQILVPGELKSNPLRRHSFEGMA
jgi:hypothetical protein